MARLTLGKLSQIRIKAGYSSAEKAGKKLKCSRWWLWQIEQGRSNLPDGLAYRMTKVYGVTRKEIDAAHKADVIALLERKTESYA